LYLTLIWYGGSNTISIWHKTTKKHIKNLSGHTGRILDMICIAVGSNEHHVWSSSFDKSILIWDTTSIVCLQELKGHTDEIRCLIQLIAPPGQLQVCSCSRDQQMMLWQYSNIKQDASAVIRLNLKPTLGTKLPVCSYHSSTDVLNKL